MPAVLAPVIASAFYEAATVGYYVVEAIAFVALSIGFAKISQSLAGDQKGSAGSSSQNQGRDVTVRGTVDSRQQILGL